MLKKGFVVRNVGCSQDKKIIINSFLQFVYTIYKIKMSKPTIKEREMKFNKLSNDWNIKLIEGTISTVSHMKDYINNGENLKKQSLLIQIFKKMHCLLS